MVLKMNVMSIQYYTMQYEMVFILKSFMFFVFSLAGRRYLNEPHDYARPWAGAVSSSLTRLLSALIQAWIRQPYSHISAQNLSPGIIKGNYLFFCTFILDIPHFSLKRKSGPWLLGCPRKPMKDEFWNGSIRLPGLAVPQSEDPIPGHARFHAPPP